MSYKYRGSVLEPNTGLIFAVVAAIFLCFLFGWGVRANSLAENKVFGVAEENVKRQQFEQTQAYREGLRRDFNELMLSYARAKSDDERSVILITLKHRVNGTPPEAVPPEVKQFLYTHLN